MDIENYLKDVHKQAKMLLDPNVSSEEYQKFKINRLKKLFNKFDKGELK